MPHRRGHRAAVAAHANDVVPRVFVAELGGHPQPAHDAHPRLRQVHVLPANLLRQQLVSRPQLVLVRLLLQDVAQARGQLARLDRLVQQIGRPQIQRLLLQTLIVQPGEHHHGQVLGLVGLPNALQQVQTADAGHLDVGHDRVVGRLQQVLPRRLRMADERQCPIVGPVVQVPPQGIQHALIVVDNQNLLLHGYYLPTREVPAIQGYVMVRGRIFLPLTTYGEGCANNSTVSMVGCVKRTIRSPVPSWWCVSRTLRSFPSPRTA